jgi:hypothetical protein
MPTTGKFFDTLVLIVLENHGWAQVQQCKFVSYLRQHGVVFTGWRAVTHPSGPNYRAMMSGNIWSSNEFDGVRRPNLGRSVDYKIYQYRGLPAKRHNPFLDMNPEDERATKFISPPLNNSELANVTYLGLDDANNAHDGALSVADDNVMQAINEFNDLSAGGRKLLLIVFDEAFGSDYRSNHVFAGAIGTDIKPRLIYSPISHYVLAQFLGDNWDVKFPEMDPEGDTYRGSSLLELP